MPASHLAPTSPLDRFEPSALQEGPLGQPDRPLHSSGASPRILIGRAWVNKRRLLPSLRPVGALADHPLLLPESFAQMRLDAAERPANSRAKTAEATGLGRWDPRFKQRTRRIPRRKRFAPIWRVPKGGPKAWSQVKRSIAFCAGTVPATPAPSA